MSWLLLCFIVTISSVASGHNGHIESEDVHGYVHQWLQAGEIASKFVWPLKDTFCRLIDSVVEEKKVKISTQCTQSLRHLKKGLTTNDHEALVLFDSFSNIQAGYLSDRVHSFGHYDQCIKSSFNLKPSRYALIKIEWPLPQFGDNLSNKISIDEWEKEGFMSNSWLVNFSKNIDHFEGLPQLVAICIPSQCSESDLRSILSLVSSKIDKVNLSLHSSQSVREDPHEWYNGSLIQRTSRGVLLLLVTWILFSTFMCQVAKKLTRLPFIKSFDVINNTRELFDFTSDSVSQTNFISGYKGLYLLAAIFHHLSLPLEASIGHFFLPIHLRMQEDALWNYSSRFFSCYSGIVSISAILQAITWFKSQENNLIPYILRRAFRTLPVTTFRILFTFSLPFAYYTGPLVFELQNSLLQKCLNNSWMEFLFISNFISFDQMCFSVSWFISADLQLFALSFITLYTLQNNEKLGYIVIVVEIIFGFACEAFVLNKFNVKPALAMLSVPRLTSVQNVFYFNHVLTHNYLASYATGILFGYLIHKRVKLNYVTSFSLLFTSGFGLVSVYWVYTQSLQCTLPRTMEILYSSFFRICAATLVGTSSLVLLSLNSYKIVQNILANKFLLLLNRLSFVAFMVHPFVIFYLHATRLETDYSFTFSSMQFTFTSVICIIIGIIVKISIEMPFDKLVREKLFTQKKKKK